MDSWYATKDLTIHIDKAGKIFYCPLKNNRKVDDSRRETPYKSVSDPHWFGDEMLRGKLVKIHGFPINYKVKPFRIAAKDICGIRWKIEQYRREGKRSLGMEKCQCRKARARNNDIGCATLAWHRLTKIARKLKTNAYALKKSLLSAHMKADLEDPNIPVCFA